MRNKTKRIFPLAQDIFNAPHLTPLHDVKVVILGQYGPYHNYGQAHGLLLFQCKRRGSSPSLEYIYQELHDDMGCTIPEQITHEVGKQGVASIQY